MLLGRSGDHARGWREGEETHSGGEIGAKNYQELAGMPRIHQITLNFVNVDQSFCWLRVGTVYNTVHLRPYIRDKLER